MATIATVKGKTPKCGKDCFIAENATLAGDIIMGDDCSIWYGAIVHAATVRKGALIGMNAVV